MTEITHGPARAGSARRPAPAQVRCAAHEHQDCCDRRRAAVRSRGFPRIRASQDHPRRAVQSARRHHRAVRNQRGERRVRLAQRHFRLHSRPERQHRRRIQVRPDLRIRGHHYQPVRHRLPRAAAAHAVPAGAGERARAPAARRPAPYRAAPAERWSLYGGETVAPGQDVFAGEIGWPSTSLGWIHGLTDTTDVGVRFDVLYSFETTTDSHFGLGLRAPVRGIAVRTGRVSLLIRADPGLKVYPGNGTPWGFGMPLGAAVGFAVNPDVRLALGLDVPITLFFGPS